MLKALFATTLLAAAFQAPGVTADELRAISLKDHAITIVDVRSAEAFALSHIAGAISVPGAKLKAGMTPPPELMKDREAYLYCT